MAIEIRELIIKTTITDEQKTGGGSQDEAVKEEIIQECIDKVMEMIKYEKER